MSNERPAQGQFDERACSAGAARYARSTTAWPSIPPSARKRRAEISSERVKDIFSTIAKKYERFQCHLQLRRVQAVAGRYDEAGLISANDDVCWTSPAARATSASPWRALHPRHIQCNRPGERCSTWPARTHSGRALPTAYPWTSRVVDAQNIPYADASYDAITMAYGIRNMPGSPARAGGNNLRAQAWRRSACLNLARRRTRGRAV